MKKSKAAKTIATGLMSAALCLLSAEPSLAEDCWIWLSEYPETTVYEVGEAFSAQGGKLAVHDAKGTNTVLDLTAPDVELSDADMTTPGKKTIQVEYHNQKTSFIIYVNGEVKPEETPIPEEVSTEQEVEKPAEEPAAPAEETMQPAETAEPETAAVIDDSDKKVVRLTLKKEPAKTTYFVGETVDFTGGVLEATYNDKSKAEIPFTQPGVEFGDAETAKAGQLKVNVSYKGKRTTLTFSVLDVGGIVTFACGGVIPDFTQSVGNGMSAAEPEIPTAAGYTFAGWYADEACTVAYTFKDNIVSEDRTVYAYWKDDTQTYYDAAYDLNYYGVVPQVYRQTVKAGETMRPIQAPVRNEFQFDGWCTDEACTTAYQNEPITADTTLFAKWTRTTSGAKEYIFEAENVNMDGQTGPGMSNEAGGSDMIVSEADKAPSGGKFLSFLYKQGITVSFHITSDTDVPDATIAFSLAAELPNINLSPENYIIRINGQDVDYKPVSIVNGEKFADHIVLSGIPLHQGHNEIQLITNNSVNPAGGGTYAGTAPIVDCMKVTSTSVLDWDGVYGLPKANQ